jgi:hypothetical protein
MATEASKTMNDFILQSAGRGGLIDRLNGTPQLGQDRLRRLNAALAEHEAAQRQGNHVAAEIADEKIEAVLTEARQAAGGQEPAPPVSFDGGYRGRQSVAPARHAAQPTASQLWRQAIAASHAERVAREADQ